MLVVPLASKLQKLLCTELNHKLPLYSLQLKNPIQAAYEEASLAKSAEENFEPAITRKKQECLNKDDQRPQVQFLFQWPFLHSIHFSPRAGLMLHNTGNAYSLTRQAYTITQPQWCNQSKGNETLWVGNRVSLCYYSRHAHGYHHIFYLPSMAGECDSVASTCQAFFSLFALCPCTQKDAA